MVYLFEEAANSKADFQMLFLSSGTLCISKVILCQILTYESGAHLLKAWWHGYPWQTKVGACKTPSTCQPHPNNHFQTPTSVLRQLHESRELQKSPKPHALESGSRGIDTSSTRWSQTHSCFSEPQSSYLQNGDPNSHLLHYLEG